MMEHAPELRPETEDERAKALKLAQTYARVFLGDDDGREVLADLRRRFGIGREVFARLPDGRLDVYGAALRDGERTVMRHVESLLAFGQPREITAPKTKRKQ